ncbi:hypothetical protein FE326_01650 [Dolosigranulum pigrum]|uniref:hypothetical protein n=2 Tax=Dolosigranulum pigrum TaxID=29394 RepID=UPI001AD862B9|nr:hypothetical protein [Dolosigranulum pigrum]QTJ40933.1 hypothetical protein FE326_01650 [Dolosigranulum pigrum]
MMKVRDWRSLGINLLIVALIIYGVHLLNIVHGIDFVYLVYIVPGVIGITGLVHGILTPTYDYLFGIGVSLIMLLAWLIYFPRQSWPIIIGYMLWGFISHWIGWHFSK